jgi:hypothetical protein
MPATLDAATAISPIAANLSDHERRCLRRAFEYLAAGNTSGFHYALWVGFGDGWQNYRQALTRAGCIEFRPRTQEAEPTPLARELLLAIDAAAAA